MYGATIPRTLVPAISTIQAIEINDDRGVDDPSRLTSSGTGLWIGVGHVVEVGAEPGCTDAGSVAE